MSLFKPHFVFMLIMLEWIRSSRGGGEIQAPDF